MNLLKHIMISLLVVLSSAAVASAQGDITGTVYQTTNVRGGPDTRFEIVGQLSEGDEVIVDGRDAQSRWLHVILPNQQGGWLPVFALVIAGDVEAIPVFVEAEATNVPDVGVFVVSYGRVNVRSGPDIAYEIVGQLDVNERAEALARSNMQNDWLMIEFGELEGWVAYFTVNVRGDTETLPVLVPDSSGESLIPPSRVLRARFNVRLHDTPQQETPVTLIVPFNSEVTAIGRTEDGEWLFVGFGDDTGWGAAQLFGISTDEIETLPVVDLIGEVLVPNAEATPEATAES